MGMPSRFSLLPSRPSFPAPKQNPAALLFEYMDQRFGKTCLKIKAKKNSFICCQGTKLTSLYMVQEGEILLTRISQDGRETLLSIVGPGDFFGESALLNGSEVTFTAKATKRSVIAQLPDRKFQLLLENPLACRHLLKTIAGRCDDAWTQMEIMGCPHVRDKVRSGLHWLSDRFGVETREGVRIDFHLTRLARMVGCARETLSREISELKRIHAVNVGSNNGRKVFYVTDPEGLFLSSGEES
jgi:CRP/FNR family transcriptional regulator, cyclic AMP receptor protein